MFLGRKYLGLDKPWIYVRYDQTQCKILTQDMRYYTPRKPTWIPKMMVWKRWQVLESMLDFWDIIYSIVLGTKLMEDDFPSGSAIKVLIWELHSSPVNDGIIYHINWLAGLFPSTVQFLLNKWSVWFEKRGFFHCSRRGRGLFDALPLISKQNFDPLVATFRPRKKPGSDF